jgi:hypothetical protein
LPGRVGWCGWVFFIFRKGGDFFYFNFVCVGKVEALLQALVCQLACGFANVLAK